MRDIGGRQLSCSWRTKEGEIERERWRRRKKGHVSARTRKERKRRCGRRNGGRGAILSRGSVCSGDIATLKYRRESIKRGRGGSFARMYPAHVRGELKNHPSHHVRYLDSVHTINSSTRTFRISLSNHSVFCSLWSILIPILQFIAWKPSFHNVIWIHQNSLKPPTLFFFTQRLSMLQDVQATNASSSCIPRIAGSVLFVRHLVHVHPLNQGGWGGVAPLVARTHVSHAIGAGKRVTKSIPYVPFFALYAIVVYIYIRPSWVFSRVPIGVGTLKWNKL